MNIKRIYYEVALVNEKLMLIGGTYGKKSLNTVKKNVHIFKRFLLFDL